MAGHGWQVRGRHGRCNYVRFAKVNVLMSKPYKGLSLNMTKSL